MKKIFLAITLLGIEIFFSGCSSDNSVTPSVSRGPVILSVTPGSIAIGAQLSVEVEGSGFTSVTGVDFGPGVKIESTETTDSQHIRLLLSATRSASPGPRTLTISTSTGTVQKADALQVTSNTAPLVRFSVSPDPGSTRTILEFDASATTDNNSIAEYEWDFGDGERKRGIKVRHQYANADRYTVRLTVTDSEDAVSSEEKEIQVLQNLLPVPSFEVSPATGDQFTEFTFDASTSFDPDGSIKLYHWEFEDGSANGKIVRHHFSRKGNFRIELIVKDTANEFAVLRKTLKVDFWDRDQAIRDINQVTTQFLVLFGRMEELSAEEIVSGFTMNPECHGRGREINVINNLKQEIRSSGVDVIGTADVPFVNKQKAKANLSARFYGTRLDGTTYSGISTHSFDMVFEETGWKICDFVVE